MSDMIKSNTNYSNILFNRKNDRHFESSQVQSRLAQYDNSDIFPSRKSRFQSFSNAKSDNGRSLLGRRDCSMPAERNLDRLNDRDLMLSLEQPTSSYYDSDVYDSVHTTAVTPPPVNILSGEEANQDFINRKAIIRPLAFRPIVKPDLQKSSIDQDPLKSTNNKPSSISLNNQKQSSKLNKSSSNSNQRDNHITTATTPLGSNATSNILTNYQGYSPPPVPPHGSRIPCKSTKQTIKLSGDSSGYYSNTNSSRVGLISTSDEISPDHFNDNYDDLPISIDNGEDIVVSPLNIGVSNTNNISSGDNIYSNYDSNAVYSTAILPNHDLIFTSSSNIKSNIDSEIKNERHRTHLLEAALANSNCKLLAAESQILDLQRRLKTRSEEQSRLMHHLACLQKDNDQHGNRNRNNVIQKQHKDNQNNESINQSTQTLSSNGSSKSIDEQSMTKLIFEFEKERQTWLDEKAKVLNFQKQIELNYEKLLFKCKKLENQLAIMKNIDTSSNIITKTALVNTTNNSNNRNFNRAQSSERQIAY